MIGLNLLLLGFGTTKYDARLMFNYTNCIFI